MNKQERKFARRRVTACILVTIAVIALVYWMSSAILYPRYMSTGGQDYWTTFQVDRMIVSLAMGLVVGWLTQSWMSKNRRRQNQDNQE